MEREYKDEEVIWDRLKVAVDGVKSMRCEGGWYYENSWVRREKMIYRAAQRTYPLVVRLVKCFVYGWMMQEPVHPINTVVGEKQEADDDNDVSKICD